MSADLESEGSYSKSPFEGGFRGMCDLDDRPSRRPECVTELAKRRTGLRLDKGEEMNRRQFFASTAAAGTVALSAVTQERQSTGKNADINVALIGGGTRGRELLHTALKFTKDAGIRFTAVCDIWEQFALSRISAQLNVLKQEHNAYADYRKMLDAEHGLDAVIIATPDCCHAEQTLACLEAGLHVYCETPMAASLEDARNMVQASRTHGQLLQAGLQRRSNPKYIHAVQNLLHNARILGRITAADLQWNRCVEPDRLWPKTRALDEAVLRAHGYESMHQFKNWTWYRHLCAGPAATFGCHQLDVLHWCLEAEPATVTARGGTHYYDPETHPWYDTLAALLEYETPKGTVSAVQRTRAANGHGGHQELILGDEGSLRLSEWHGLCQVLPEGDRARAWTKWVDLGYLKSPTQEEEGAGKSDVDVHETVRPPAYEAPIAFKDPPAKPHLENFFDAVRGNAELNCPGEIGYQALAAALKINQAAAEAKCITVDPQEFTV